MELTTKDNLTDILHATVAVEEDEQGNTLLVLYDSTVWTIFPSDNDSFFLCALGLPTC